MMLVIHNRPRYNDTMSLILLICIYLLLVAVAAVRLPASQLSVSELARRATGGDVPAKREHERQVLRPQLMSLQRMLALLLIILLTTWAAWTLGWLQGGIVAAGAVLTYTHVARLPWIARFIQRWYRASEPVFHEFVHSRRLLMRVLGTTHEDHSRRIASRAELLELIEQARADDISPRLRRHLQHVVASEGKTIDEIMTPRSQVATIADDETLGPLVLDSLHKTGYSRFPVLAHETEQVIGILSIDDLLTIRHHDTAVVRDVMEHDIETIGADTTLERTLNKFLRARHHMLIVADCDGRMIGIVTLEDVLETMLGEHVARAD